MDLGRTALILPGGGMKCAFQAGSLKAFEEERVEFVRAQGISGGALNIAKYYEGGAAALLQVWLDVEKRGPGLVFSRWDAAKHIVKGDNALFSDYGISLLLGQLDISKLINHPIPIEIIVFNETLEKLEIITNHQYKDCPTEEWEKFRRFVKASSSFAGLLPPEIINNQVYSDGRVWVLDNFGDCDTIFIVDPGQPQIITNNPADLANRKWHKRLIQSSTFGYDNWAEKELQIFADHNEFQFFPEPETDATIWNGIKRIAKRLAGKPAKKRIVVIHPSANIENLRMDYFIKGDITISKNHGYERTKEILNKLSKCDA